MIWNTDVQTRILGQNAMQDNTKKQNVESNAVPITLGDNTPGHSPVNVWLSYTWKLTEVSLVSLF